MYARRHGHRLTTMIKFGVILVACLLAGCAAMNESAYMPGENQLKDKNPYLLNCPSGSAPVCSTHGGRLKKTFTNCTCGR